MKLSGSIHIPADVGVQYGTSFVSRGVVITFTGTPEALGRVIAELRERADEMERNLGVREPLPTEPDPALVSRFDIP